MAKSRSKKFAAGSASEPFSNIWRVTAAKNDVYIGTTKTEMGLMKLSLHESGTWIYAATSQSGMSLQPGNRRAKQWSQPKEHFPGIVRGPWILIPRTSFGKRALPQGEVTPDIFWHKAPELGQAVSFNFYLVKKGAQEKWNSHEIVVAEVPLKNGGKVVVLSETVFPPPQLLANYEKFLDENRVNMNGSTLEGGMLLVLEESQDHLKIPILVDLPVPTTVT